MEQLLFVMLMEDHRPLTGEVVERHVAHLRALDDAGQLALCGPFADCGGGMVVLRAATWEAADQLARSDPFIREGYKTYRLRTLEVAHRENGYLLG